MAFDIYLALGGALGADDFLKPEDAVVVSKVARPAEAKGQPMLGIITAMRVSQESGDPEAAIDAPIRGQIRDAGEEYLLAHGALAGDGSASSGPLFCLHIR